MRSLFNRANTDAAEVHDSVELVMMRAAHETLLKSGFKTAKLKQKLAEHFSGELINPSWESGSFTEAQWQKRWSDKPAVQRPLAMWIDDFSDARNASAHGTASICTHDPSIWSIDNHLMFASWLFPLIVKKILETAGVCFLTEDERDCRA